MKIYLAGPMRGVPEFNFPAFHTAAKWLRARGHIVFNPAEKDIERYGVDISVGNVAGDEFIAAEQHGFNPRTALRIALGADLAYICADADVVVVLPGWAQSKGAYAEVAVANALGLDVLNIDSVDFVA